MQGGDRLVLVFGEDLGEDLVDAELAADGVGDLPGVAGDHRHVDPDPAEVVDGLSGLGSDLVLEGERSDHLVIVEQVQHCGATLLPRRDRILQLAWDIDFSVAQQRGATDRIAGAVDGRLDTASGQ